MAHVPRVVLLRVLRRAARLLEQAAPAIPGRNLRFRMRAAARELRSIADALAS